MMKKNKVINLFPNTTSVPNAGAKYSQLLEQFMNPFVSQFKDYDYVEDIMEFGINAWNTANMDVIMPSGDIAQAMSFLPQEDIPLLKKMIAFKKEKFKEFTNFIVDFELKEAKAGVDPILSVVTQEEDAYLATMLSEIEKEDELHTEEDFEENYINRSAIVLKPLQPFFDWINALYPEDKMTEVEESNTYLVNNEIEDVNTWLKKKYDKLFKMELDEWHSNKKEWPKNRNYKMFKQWFQVDISTMIYDLEKEPVSKSE
jgi:hypothetical protein